MNKVAQASSLTEAFATRNGVTDAQPPSRYLWINAFAVCNFLALHRELHQHQHPEWAIALVEQMHAVLGCHATVDVRSGWQGGVDDRDHRLHSTRRGLRIGEKGKRAGRAPEMRRRRYLGIMPEGLHHLAPHNRGST